MTGATPLDGREADALHAELGVQPFALGREALRPVARLAGLERISERMARNLRGVIEPLVKAKPQVLAEPLDTCRFEAWRDALPAFTSLGLYRLPPLKGGVLIALEPDFVTRMVDAFYGGSGAAGKPGPRATEFTATEERLAARLADAVVEQIVDGWSGVAKLVPTPALRETNAAYASLVRADEQVVVQRFGVVAGPAGPTRIDIVYPLASLRLYEAQLGAKVHDDAGHADADWRARMAAALRDVRLPVRSVLARPSLSLAELINLKPGDVIPITLAPKVPLIVANKRLAQGTIGEQDGRAALMIETIDADANKGKTR